MDHDVALLLMLFPTTDVSSPFLNTHLRPPQYNDFYNAIAYHVKKLPAFQNLLPNYFLHCGKNTPFTSSWASITFPLSCLSSELKRHSLFNLFLGEDITYFHTSSAPLPVTLLLLLRLL